MKSLTIRTECSWALGFPLANGKGKAACHLDEEGRMLVLLDREVLRIHRGKEKEVMGTIQDGFGCCARVVDLLDGTALGAFKGGALLKMEVATAEAFDVEEVGFVESGLEEMSLSPDLELLVLVTCAGAVLIMNREFDPICECGLHQDSFGESGFVNVGWGKKETQFQGSLGKAAATARDSGKNYRSEHDDSSVRVTWRDDGELFAVSYLPHERSCPRTVRIFSREGVLQATSEAIRGLEHNLSWRPAGAMIASTVRAQGDKYEVAFLEKNGLRHGGFRLRRKEDDVTVTDLLWSRGGDALAVVSNAAKSGEDRIEIYMSSNYHWALQQSWAMPRIAHLQWDQMKDLRLHVLTEDGNYCIIQLGWETFLSDGLSESNPSFVARVDGDMAHVTPFRNMVLPPPLSAFDIRVPADIKQVIFSPEGCDAKMPPDITVVTGDALFVFGDPPSDRKGNTSEDVEVLRREADRAEGGFRRVLQLPGAKSVARIPPLEGRRRHLNWCQLVDGHLLASVANVLRLYALKSESSDEEGPAPAQFLVLLGETSCEDVVYGVSRDHTGRTAAVQLADGSVLRYDLRPGPGDGDRQPDFRVRPWEHVRLRGGPYQQMSVAPGPRLLGLTAGGRLQLDGREICSDASSFALHSDFLLLTDLSHRLRCLPLKCLKNVDAAGADIWLNGSTRAVERGAKLVLAVPKDSRVVLQMPRGNLELVHPRALTLHLARCQLDEGRLDLAMELLRCNRVNLNLLVDHDPVAFLQGGGVANFVRQVDNPQRICLFIADLQEEDCTSTIYSSVYPSRRDRSSSPLPNKVEAVCRALSEVLEQVNPERFINPILSCQVKRDPKEGPTKALLRIQKIRGEKPKLADEALQFLLLLVDINKLFDVALGTYDFQLVLFVAEKSQKDPKEYLPFLNDLRKLPTPLRHFRIDVHLRRFLRALKHLDGWDGFVGESIRKECLDIIVANRMYSDALRIFASDKDFFKAISEKYGYYLASKRYYDEAALVFWDAGLTRDACEWWERSLDWRRCLTAALACPMDAGEMALLCSRLVEVLKSAGRCLEAASILLHHCGREEEAVEVLVEGGCWADADRMIAKQGRKDLYETHYLPCLRSSASSSLALASSTSDVLSAALSRLRAVLAERRRGRPGCGAGDVSGGFADEDADLYSDTTSLAHTGAAGSSWGGAGSNPASLKTRVSQRSKSSKNRRKNEKKYSTREGSVYEDIGLIAQIHQIISNIYKSLEPTGDLLRALVMAREKDSASELQRATEALLSMCGEAAYVAWEEANDSGRDGQGGETYRFGPDATTADILEKEGGEKVHYWPPMHLLESHLRLPPPPSPVKNSWRLEILSPSKVIHL